jgi:hypothetical protein
MRHFLAFVIVVGLAVLPARADVPLPKNLRYIDPRVRFENVDAYPDHVFYLRYLTFSGGPANIPYTLVSVKNIQPFNLNAQRRLINMHLLAVERKTFEEKAKQEPDLKWLTDKTDGVLKASFNEPSTTAPANVKEAPVTNYRIQLKGGKLRVVPGEQKSRQAEPAGPLPVRVLAVAFSVSLAWLGIWFAGRGRTQAPSTPD